MKIAMLGGTFDPIHLGHIRLGQYFAEKLELDKVLIIPTRTPPHKQKKVTPAEHRLEMCRIAAEYAGDKFEVSDIYKTSVCPLAKVMRRELKKRNINSLKVLYSKEEPIKPLQQEDLMKRPVPGSVSFVPSVAGLIIAGEVIKDLISK